MTIAGTCSAIGGPYKPLYSFKGLESDGAYPLASLIRDKAGDLYGTTSAGGSANAGTVFELAPDGTETVLHSFDGDNGTNDGDDPMASLIQDNAGNLYGTTWEGGIGTSGTVFKVAPNGTTTILYSFTGGADGGYPAASLIRDGAKNLYGTTAYGGDGFGVVFKLAPDGTESALYSFTGLSDGSHPISNLIQDEAGNFYGTTTEGGSDGSGCYYGHGCGTVFELTPDGTETVLHSFTDSPDGGDPVAGLIRDAAGDLYGATSQGGRLGCGHRLGCGVVFEIIPDGTETVLYAFKGHADGMAPGGGLVRDAAGNLYGTTQYGGTTGWGTIFEVAPDGTETVLHSFKRNTGTNAGLIQDKRGNFYGTTEFGGMRGGCECGTVFRLTT